MEHLVKFWLESKSFNSTTWSRIRAYSLNTVKHSSLAEPVSPAPKRPDLSAVSSLASAKQLAQDSSKVPQHTSRLKGLDSPAKQHSTSNHLQAKQKIGRVPAIQLEICTDQTLPSHEQSSMLNASRRDSPTDEGLKDMSQKLMKSKLPIYRFVNGFSGENRNITPAEFSRLKQHIDGLICFSSTLRGDLLAGRT